MRSISACPLRSNLNYCICSISLNSPFFSGLEGAVKLTQAPVIFLSFIISIIRVPVRNWFRFLTGTNTSSCGELVGLNRFLWGTGFLPQVFQVFVINFEPVDVLPAALEALHCPIFLKLNQRSPDRLSRDATLGCDDFVGWVAGVVAIQNEVDEFGVGTQSLVVSDVIGAAEVALLVLFQW